MKTEYLDAAVSARINASLVLCDIFELTWSEAMKMPKTIDTISKYLEEEDMKKTLVFLQQAFWAKSSGHSVTGPNMDESYAAVIIDAALITQQVEALQEQKKRQLASGSLGGVLR